MGRPPSTSPVVACQVSMLSMNCQAESCTVKYGTFSSDQGMPAALNVSPGVATGDIAAAIMSVVAPEPETSAEGRLEQDSPAAKLQVAGDAAEDNLPTVKSTDEAMQIVDIMSDHTVSHCPKEPFDDGDRLDIEISFVAIQGCPECAGPLVWSDYAIGAYADSWMCENVDTCGSWCYSNVLDGSASRVAMTCVPNATASGQCSYHVCQGCPRGGQWQGCQISQA